MTAYDPKEDLKTYLQGGRETLLWKLDGLSEYDVRRPMVSTGTNLLGLVKHNAVWEFVYFGDTFGRPSGEPMPWLRDETGPGSAMWATSNESRQDIIDLYRRAWGHSNATIDALPLDATGYVPHWPAGHNEVTLHRVLAHFAVETQRHAGHADIIRELIDGAVGLLPAYQGVQTHDSAWWQDHRDRLQGVAEAANRE